jgi:hypothetical protein
MAVNAGPAADGTTDAPVTIANVAIHFDTIVTALTSA